LSVRFTKSPKLYFVDVGLLLYLLNINLERAIIDNVLMGKVLENFVVSELKKQATWSKTVTNLYHFRTSGGDEVDVVLENNGGSIVGIEVKLAEKVAPQDFKGLSYLQEKSGTRFVAGVVLYTGSQVIPFGERLWAMPVSMLWR